MKHETTMTTQPTLPFDTRPEPFPANRGTDRAQEQIDQAHDLCQWFRDRQKSIRVLLADDRIVTADQIEEPNR